MPRLRELFVRGRQAVPIRAIPFATAWELTPDDIACAVVQIPDWDGRRFMTVLTVHSLNTAGDARPLARFESAEWASNVGDLARARADRIDQIRAMPQGWFVWETELRGLLQEINRTLMEPPPNGPGAAPIELSCCPVLNDVDESLVLEGFDFGLLDSGSHAVPIGPVSATVPGAHQPAADDTLPTAAFVTRNLTQAQLDRRVARVLATRLWGQDPTLSQTAIVQSAEFANLRGKYRDRKTLPGWIRDVDPRPVTARRGRRKRRP